MKTTLMADATGAASRHLAGFTGGAIAGYVTGSGVVPWSGADFDFFPHKYKIRINQHDAFRPLVGNVLDIESQAWTVGDAMNAMKAREGAQRHTTVYLSRSMVPSLVAATHNHGILPVYLWVADWSLDRTAAEKLIGTRLDGLEVVGVQYASPSSNPHDVLPGTPVTIAQANADLSVVSHAWLDAVAEAPVADKPPQPPPGHAQTGLLITAPLNARKVTSHDGKVWHIPA